MGSKLDHMTFGFPVEGFLTGTGKGVLQDSDIVPPVDPVRELAGERVLRGVNSCGFLLFLGRDDTRRFCKKERLVGIV